MTAAKVTDHAAPMAPATLFFLHALGGSTTAWAGVVDRLPPALRCVPLDLSGFGDRASEGTQTVEEMVDGVAATVRRHAPDRWWLIGHSMGGKIATLLAARAEAGGAGLAGLAGVILIAASPPSPEPMAEDRRREMLSWLDEDVISDRHARAFVRANIAEPLPAPAMEQAVADVRRSSPQAWRGWLTRGSLEDWSGAAGRLRTPALIVAGAEDGDLGEGNQRRLNLPHYRSAQVAVIDGAAHLMPLERPAELARLIEDRIAAAPTPPIPLAMERLIASDRVSRRTRAVMLARLDEPDGPFALDGDARRILAALVDRLVPHGTDVDIAARIDADLASGPGDGWRFADLPPDADAYRHGLATLAEHVDGFATLPDAERDAAIVRAMAGEIGGDRPGRLTPAQMVLWLEDVRADAIRAWMSHPAAMARIGYDGFATGGDGVRKQGFTDLAAGRAEAWQLRAGRR